MSIHLCPISRRRFLEGVVALPALAVGRHLSESGEVPWMADDGVGTAVDDPVPTIILDADGWLEELVH